MMIQDREMYVRAEIKYIQEHAYSKEKIKDLNKIFDIYHNQMAVGDKISQQNKQIKQKLIELEE